MMTSRNLVVCKVGGSLFDWPLLFPRLAELLAGESRHVLLIAGGGPAADVVRKWDCWHGLGEERAHRLAIRSLRLSEAFLADGLPESVIVTNSSEGRSALERGLRPVLNVEGYLANESETALPASWDVTSDSIAAWVAQRWGGDVLLVKSTSPERAGERFVDRCFAEFAQGLQVEWCDLRSGARDHWPA